MLGVISKIPSYYLFRKMGRPRKLPLNLTFSVCYRCNSRCKTCNVYKKHADELSLREWRKIFKKIGKTPFWTTFSGGEPFLRKDLIEVVCEAYSNCRPSIINIPTNGLLVSRIPESVRDIARHCKKSQVVINVSIDDINEKHDKIRGIAGNYEKAIETFKKLKSIDASNLSIGIHTVISKYNVKRIPHIYEVLQHLKPDSYITEIAEERVELGTIGSSISPAYDDYVYAIDFLINKLNQEGFSKVGKIARAFRIEYYKLVKKIIKDRYQVIPCYAGSASAQIAPDGDVWSCCTRAESFGNLRKVDYDFGKIWFSERANILRKSIKDRECYCPLANAGYTNMLHNIGSLSRATWNLIKAK